MDQVSRGRDLTESLRESLCDRVALTVYGIHEMDGTG